MTGSTQLPADDVLDAVQPAGKTAGLGASTRERIERTVRGYQRVGEETVTFEQFLRDLRFDGFKTEIVRAVAENIFWDETIHVYPPYAIVDETATVVSVGEETWEADRESWPATRWTCPSREQDLNSTQLHDTIRQSVREGEHVVVSAAGETIHERERPLRE